MRTSLRTITAYFIGLGLVTARVVSSSHFRVAVLDGILLVYLCWVVWLLPDRSGRFRSLKLLTIFNCIYFGIMGLMLLVMEAQPSVFRPETLGLLYRKVGGDPIANLDRGLLLALTAQVMLTVAFLIPLPAPRTRNTSQRGLSVVMSWLERPVVLVSITLAFVVSRVWPDHVPLVGAQLVYVWGTLFEAVLAMRLVRWLRDRPLRAEKALRWLWIVVMIVAAGLYSGWRGRLIELAALLVIALVADRGEIRLRWIAIGSLAFGLLIVPWSITYRSILWGGPDEGLAGRIRAGQIATQETASLSLHDRALTSFSFVGLRVGSQRIDELSGVAAQSTRLNGRSIWPFLAGPVPRAVWQSKPQMSPQLNVIAHSLGKGQPSDFGTSMVWTQYTDLVLNFGTMGLLVGAFILGLFARWLNSVFLVAGRRTPEAVGLFTLFFSPLWREHPVGLVYQLEVQFLIILLVVFLMTRDRQGLARRGVRHVGDLGHSALVEGGRVRAPLLSE